MRPLIIVGAARSGTNLLRDLICQAPGFATWPCDEINLLWRHGNALHPDDQLEPEQARPEVARYLRASFEAIARRSGASTVVEKTCANSLRIGFVDRVLPEARYLWLVRDGRDAAASAMERFSAPFDWRYTLRKLRYVPAADLPYYAAQFARNRATRLLRRDRRLASWGPRFRGFAEFARTATVAELCARQWRECVDLAARDLAAIPAERAFRVHYEQLVAHPAPTLRSIFEYLGAPEAASGIDVRHVSAASVGRHAALLAAEGAGRALAILAPTLARHGYE